MIEHDLQIVNWPHTACVCVRNLQIVVIVVSFFLNPLIKLKINACLLLHHPPSVARKHSSLHTNQCRRQIFRQCEAVSHQYHRGEDQHPPRCEPDRIRNDHGIIWQSATSKWPTLHPRMCTVRPGRRDLRPHCHFGLRACISCICSGSFESAAPIRMHTANWMREHLQGF